MKNRVQHIIFAGLLIMISLNSQCQNIATISGKEVYVNNGIVEAVIDGGRMTSLSFTGQPNLLNNGGSGYFSIVDNVGFKTPTDITPMIWENTEEMADIYFRMMDNIYVEMHYVFKQGESGFYIYFVMSDAMLPEKEMNSARFALRVDKDLFTYAWTAEREGPMVHPDELVNYLEEIQDATYLLQDSSIYTKYDWAVYKIYDLLHGLMGEGTGIWNMEPSHEYHNGGTTMQELTLHGTNTTPILLSQFHSNHYGNTGVLLRDEYKQWSKIYGPQFIYLNSGTNEQVIADAKQKALELKEQWPFQWLRHELYPRERGSLTGRLDMVGGGEVDSAMVLLCKSGPSWMNNEDHWQWQPYEYFFWAEADPSGNFTVENIRPGTYTLYAYTQQGKLIDELRLDGIEIGTEEFLLGPVQWDAKDRQKTIFQVGIANHKSSEYKLGDLPRAYGRWKECPLSLSYDTETGSPEIDWYYCQRVNSTWEISFSLDDTSSLIDPQIKVALAGVDARPHLDIILNGSIISVNDLGTDSGIRRSSLASGKYEMITCDVDIELLKEGENILTLECYGSSQEYKGIMYDAILFEADTNRISGIPCHESGVKVEVYPNPASSMLFIKSEMPVSFVRILDYSGRLITHQDSEDSSSEGIDISSLCSGVYLIQLHTEGEIIVKRIIISH